MEWMDETSINLTSQKHTAKKKRKKVGEAKSNNPTQLQALWNWGWQQSIQCLKLVGASVVQPFFSFFYILQHYYSHSIEHETKKLKRIKKYSINQY